MGSMRWQDWASLILGAWLAISPWVLGFNDSDWATWNAVVVGVAIAAYAFVEIDMPKPWEEWANLVLGVWLIASPLALGYQVEAVPAWNAVFVGVLVVLLAAWAMSLDKEIWKWWHDHVTGH
jgi:multisubunit Na+/H+ antiporter MnhB subunit